MALVAPFPSGAQPDLGAVTDWVEFSAINSRSAFKRGDLKSAISVEGISNEGTLEEQVWVALKVREGLHAQLWPFKIDGPRLVRRKPCPVPSDLYRYLCCMGMGLVDDEDRKLFELVIAEVLPALTRHPSMHIGHPASEGMAPSFRARVAAYAAASRMLTEEVKDDPPSTDNDFGIDAVSWMPFADARSGYLHFLAQCATGANWEDKTLDIHVKNWQRHIFWGVDPVRVFAVPFVVTVTNVKWLRLCGEAGLILDRPRILELYSRLGMGTRLLPAIKRRVAALAA